jgi:hypothetical protein
VATVQVPWNPFDQHDPGPCIKVQIVNSPEVIEAGRAVGLEYPSPVTVTALLDTGASVTLISRRFADYCKLRQTNEGRDLRHRRHPPLRGACRVDQFPQHRSSGFRFNPNNFCAFRKRALLLLPDRKGHPAKLDNHLRRRRQAGNDQRARLNTGSGPRAAPRPGDRGTQSCYRVDARRDEGPAGCGGKPFPDNRNLGAVNGNPSFKIERVHLVISAALHRE